MTITLPPDVATRYRPLARLDFDIPEASVVLGERLSDKQRVVLKVYRPGVDLDQSVASLADRVAPQHVLRRLDCGIADGAWYEVLEHPGHGTLRDLLDLHGRLEPVLLADVVRELTEAVEYLHTQSIVHCNVRPENVVVRSFDPLDLALVDLGFAGLAGGRAAIDDMPITPSPYRAPEVASRRRRATFAADYWALGAIVLEAATGMLDVSPRAIQTVASSSMLALCSGLLERNPTRRWGSARIRKWLRRHNAARQRRHLRLLDEVAQAIAAEPERVRPVLETLVGRTPARTGQLRQIARRVDDVRRDNALGEFQAGSLPTDQVVTRLPSISTRQGVHRLRKAGKLLGRTVGNTTWYPAWQFSATGVRDDLDDILPLITTFTTDVVAADRIMGLPREELGGGTIAEALDDADLRPRALELLAALGGG